MVVMAVAMTAAMAVTQRWRRHGEGGGDGGGKGGSRWTRQDEGAVMAGARGGVRRRGGREEEKTVALCGAGNLASTRCVVRRGAVSSGLVYVLPYTSRVCV